MFFSFLAAIFIHEMGHILFARIFGVRIRSFRWCTAGAILEFDFSHCGYLVETLIHLAGALCGVTSALIIHAIGGVSTEFLGISVFLAVINLLPIRGFDGGAALYAVLEQFLFVDTAWKISSVVSIITTVILWLAVIWCEIRVGANLELLIFVLIVLYRTTAK